MRIKKIEINNFKAFYKKHTIDVDGKNLFIYGAATKATGNSATNFLAASYVSGGATLDGGAGDDRLIGSAGNDILIGGTGADTMSGDGGNDVFQISRGQALGDTITDFMPGFDRLKFVGFSSFATFTAIDATHWQVNYGTNLATHEIITFTNAPSIQPSDVLFV